MKSHVHEQGVICFGVFVSLGLNNQKVRYTLLILPHRSELHRNIKQLHSLTTSILSFLTGVKICSIITGPKRVLLRLFELKPTKPNGDLPIPSALWYVEFKRALC